VVDRKNRYACSTLTRRFQFSNGGIDHARRVAAVGSPREKTLSVSHLIFDTGLNIMTLLAAPSIFRNLFILAVELKEVVEGPRCRKGEVKRHTLGSEEKWK
jgi:hypothetical protein